ncbi:hypothetical protein NE237_025777 [Protea cynaroides]|uniref:Uncharacterized protein n=1 Tax=Protea cynaroides TaxID=273540 RepID=A0A9Q0K0I4_9MAGN|nr:hypothetical protein NE237_025777 [Protea cynaroides]
MFLPTLALPFGSHLRFDWHYFAVCEYLIEQRRHPGCEPSRTTMSLHLKYLRNFFLTVLLHPKTTIQLINLTSICGDSELLNMKILDFTCRYSKQQLTQSFPGEV